MTTQVTSIPRVTVKPEQVRGLLKSFTKHIIDKGNDKKGRMVLLHPAKKRRDGTIVTYSNTKEYHI